MAEVWVIDSSPLIALASVEVLPTIARLRARILVPEAVANEVIGEGRRLGAPEADAVSRLVEARSLRVERVRDMRRLAQLSENPRLSKADAACLALAIEHTARLIADEKDLRGAAASLGLPFGGSLFLLASAVKARILRPEEAARAAQDMVAKGWYCSPILLQSFTQRIRTEQQRGRK